MIQAAATRSIFNRPRHFCHQEQSRLHGGGLGENKGSFNVCARRWVRGFWRSKFTTSANAPRKPDEILEKSSGCFGFRCQAISRPCGAKENLRLQEILGFEKVWEIFHANQGVSHKWDQDRSMYITDRTRIMDNLIIPIQETK